MQAAGYDRMMQQQGTSYQMGMAGGGMGGMGGFGASAYPSNLQFNASLGGGW
jgi:hypothetical protein